MSCLVWSTTTPKKKYNPEKTKISKNQNRLKRLKMKKFVNVEVFFLKKKLQPGKIIG